MGHSWVQPDVTDETLRILQDEAVSQALVDRSIPESKVGFGEPAADATLITNSTVHLTIPADGQWKDVHSLHSSIGPPLRLTPRRSGWVEMVYSGAMYSASISSPIRLTFQVNGDRVSGNAQNDGMAYSDLDARWTPATIAWMWQYPVGEPLDIRLNARVSGSAGNGLIIGAASTTILYAKEVF